jgi:hypothetical protein
MSAARTTTYKSAPAAPGDALARRTAQRLAPLAKPSGRRRAVSRREPPLPRRAFFAAPPGLPCGAMPAPVARAVDRCAQLHGAAGACEPAPAPTVVAQSGSAARCRQSDGIVHQPARRAAPHRWWPRARLVQRRGGPRGRQAPTPAARTVEPRRNTAAGRFPCAVGRPPRAGAHGTRARRDRGHAPG